MELPTLRQLQPHLFQPRLASWNPSSKTARPANSFILYRMWQTRLRSDVRDAPARSFSDISAELGEMWRAESAVVVQHFENLSEEGKRLHKLKYPDYKFRPQKKKDSLTKGTGHDTLSATAGVGPSRTRSSRTIRSRVNHPTPTPHGDRVAHPSDSSNIVNATPPSPLASESQVELSASPPSTPPAQTSHLPLLPAVDRPSAPNTDTTETTMNHGETHGDTQITHNDAHQWPLVIKDSSSLIPTCAAPSTPRAESAGSLHPSAMNTPQNNWNQQAYEFGVPLTPADDPFYLYDISCGHFPDEHNAECAAGLVYPSLSLEDQPGDVDVSIGTVTQAGIFADEFSNPVPQYGDEEPFDVYDPVRFEAEDYSRFSSEDFYTSHFDASLAGEALDTPILSNPRASQFYYTPTEEWTGY